MKEARRGAYQWGMMKGRTAWRCKGKERRWGRRGRSECGLREFNRVVCWNLYNGFWIVESRMAKHVLIRLIIAYEKGNRNRKKKGDTVMVSNVYKSDMILSIS